MLVLKLRVTNPFPRHTHSSCVVSFARRSQEPCAACLPKAVTNVRASRRPGVHVSPTGREVRPTCPTCGWREVTAARRFPDAHSIFRRGHLQGLSFAVTFRSL